MYPKVRIQSLGQASFVSICVPSGSFHVLGDEKMGKRCF